MYSQHFESYESLIYTHAAAAWAVQGAIESLDIWENCVHVIYWVGDSRKSTFVSKKMFKYYFAESRKARAKTIEVTQNVYEPHKYTALSSKGDRRYQVIVYRTTIECDCPDLRKQTSVFGVRPKACKHIYAVLAKMGFKSLSEYLETSKSPLQKEVEKFQKMLATK